ncbi:MAG: hypothetical protein J2P25_04520 [Nocardiopsaceae bacterium]|nr:hypothetical protein [Nocardiopsaceae bacterium]
MAAVTRDRIGRVHAHVADALDRTGPSSVVPAREQDRLLAQACGEVCDLLTDWLASDDWARLRPPRGATVADAIPGRRDYAAFLDPALADVLTMSGLAAETAGPMVREAREAVARTARRHARWRQEELFREADDRVRELRADTCAQAARLRALLSGSAEERAGTVRDRAQAVLKRVRAFLPTLALTMASVVVSVTPAQVAADVHAWEHAAAQVVAVYLVAEQAQPGLAIEPPDLEGPELGL